MMSLPLETWIRFFVWLGDRPGDLLPLRPQARRSSGALRTRRGSRDQVIDERGAGYEEELGVIDIDRRLLRKSVSDAACVASLLFLK